MSEHCILFISYSRKDKNIAQIIVQTLRNEGIEVKIDEDIIDDGDDWKKRIESSIRSSTALLLLISSNSIKSEHVQYEVKYAQNNSKAIVSMKIDSELKDKSLPTWASKWQYILYKSPDYLVRLLATCNRKVIFHDIKERWLDIEGDVYSAFYSNREMAEKLKSQNSLIPSHIENEKLIIDAKPDIIFSDEEKKKICDVIVKSIKDHLNIDIKVSFNN